MHELLPFAVYIEKGLVNLVIVMHASDELVQLKLGPME